MLHRFNIRGSVTAFALLCAMASLLGCTASAAPQPIPEPGMPLPTATPRPVKLPLDHAAHDAETEWWYYSGHARSETGREYGFHVALFRTDGGDSGRTYDRVQASVIDLQNGARWHWTRDGVTEEGRSVVTAGELLNVLVGDARIQIRGDGTHILSVSDSESGLGIELTLASSDSLMLHDDIGWIPFPFGYSYYYTQPRLSATGTIRTGTGPAIDTVEVSGEVWYDHQWGDFIVLGWPGGWYWTGLHLDDGASLMLSEVRGTDGERYRLFGTYLGADGRQQTLDADRDGIEIEHLEYWTSAATGAEYPVSSRIRVASLALDVILVPRIVDQETITSIGDDNSATYWEGSVIATDSVSGDAVGQGYLELAGYVLPDPLSWRDR